MFEDKTVKIYSSRDMIRQQLIKYAERYLEIQPLDLTKTSYMSYLINILSVLTSNLIYYNSATYREFFLTRAQQKESVLNLSAMLGYTPDLASPAQTRVLVQMPTSFETSVSVTLTGRRVVDEDGKYKQPFRFYAGNTVFVSEHTVEIQIIKDRGRLMGASVREIRINPNQTGQNVIAIPWVISSDQSMLYFNVNVTQVDDQSFTFTLPEVAPYEFVTKEVPFTGSIADIDVRTREVVSYSPVPRTMQDVDREVIEYGDDDWIVWDYEDNKNSIYLVDTGTNGYAWRATEEGVKLFWGNDVIGTQPPAGYECVTTISTTEGIRGNVISGSITKTEKLFAEAQFGETDQNRYKPVKLSVINEVPATGGKNYPTIDEIRKAALVQVSTNERLVTEYDYENINTIVEDLPIQHAIPILKRSDIKQNEIVLFTDILFRDRIVPTRNETIEINESDYPVDENNEPQILIRTGDVVNALNIQDEVSFGETPPVYISMFDVTLDTTRRTATYRYVLDEVRTEVVLQHAASTSTTDGSSDLTPMYPNFAKFKVTTNESNIKVVDVFIILRKTIDDETAYENILGRCAVGNNEAEDMDYLDDLEEAYSIYNIAEFGNADENDVAFHIQYLLDDNLSPIVEDSIDFTFSINLNLDGEMVPGSDPPVPDWDYYINCSTSAIIKKDLGSYMYSMSGKVLVEEGEDVKWRLFDVPLILKEWWEYMLGLGLRDELILDIFNRLVTFDVTSYRMMTDFVNLKFSNTYGPLTNMRFDEANRGEIIGINPSPTDIACDLETGFGCIDATGVSEASSNDAPRWAVTNIGAHPWINISNYDDNETIRTVPFIAAWNKYINDWLFSPLEVNDIMTISGEGEEQYYGGNITAGKKKYIFNGESIFSVDKQIPLDVKIEVWLDPTYPSTDQGTIDRIKQNIIDGLFDRMGYDKPIYRSEITDIVQSTPGIRHCTVIRPEHDIFFNYDIYEDFSQEELLRYAPQLVQMTIPNITVLIRS